MTVKLLAWAFYEFAATVFSMNVLSRYFALWVKEGLGGSDLSYSVAYSGSLFLSLLGMPLLGTLSDRLGRRMPFLWAATITVFLGTVAFSSSRSLPVILILFAITNFGYQTGFLFFNTLLPAVSGSHARVGPSAGLSVALGYLGGIAGLLAVAPFVKAGGYAAAFLPTAILYLLASLPALLCIRDASSPSSFPGGRRRGNEEPVLKSLRAALGELRGTARTIRVRRFPLYRFLLANLIFSDAINTATLFMAVYARRVAGFSDSQVDRFLILSTVFAMAGGLFFGRVVKRYGSYRAMRYALAGWMAVLAGVLLFAETPLFWAVGPLAGICFGGFWVSGRSLLVHLSPPEEIGKYFGFYSLTEKFTAVLGPLLWGVTVTLMARAGSERWGYRLAVAEFLAAVVAGFYLLRRVRADREAIP
jgi:UMF1 family MFS transporter